MSHETIIDTATVAAHLDDPDWVVVDCRYDIRLPERCEREYRQAHISTAVYAHLDRDLSGPAIEGRTGRHPLPEPAALAKTFSAWGIGARTQVVAYDESTGAIAAARLWWLLKWAGHDAVAVLDGGFKKWCAEGLSYSTGIETKQPAAFRPDFRPQMALDADAVAAILGDPAWVVLDARSAERYEGVGETIDPHAGHIAGAISAPYAANLREDGTFKPAPNLAGLFDAAMGGRAADHVVLYCGSGVTATNSVLACVHAGKGMPCLYPGSWSDWITDPARPTATGKGKR
jgi:thiosulfate/3-mercaptopyruvate sulfurtransferase